MRSDVELYAVAELIENTGYWLQQSNPHLHARKLRLMQQKVSERSESSTDPNLTFLDHFLSTYINRLWSNLAVDFTYESGGPGKEVLGKLFQNIGKNLVDLSDALRQENLKKYYDALLGLTSAYRRTLLELREKESDMRREKQTFGTIRNPASMRSGKKPLYKILEESKAITQSEYQLAGGAPSNYFFDIDKLLSKPRYVNIVSEYFIKEINDVMRVDRIDKLAFIEKHVGTVGALPLMSSIISKSKMEGFIIRIWKDVTIGEIKGSPAVQPRKGEHIGIVSDVATVGQSIKRAVEGILRYEVESPYAFVLYDREQGAKRVLKKDNVDLRAILTRSELEEIGFIPKERESSEDPPLDTENMNTIPPAEWKARIWGEV